MADYSAPVSDFQPHASVNDEDSNPLSFSFSGGRSPNSNIKASSSTIDNHQQTDEKTAKRRTGRPRGSKNKPKPPIVVRRDSETSPLKTVAFEISPGFDVIERIINFACRNHVGVGIISATGSVSNVELCNASPLQPPLFLEGPLELHSLIGSFFPEYVNPPSSNGPVPQSSLSCHSFHITLEGPQFQLLGGRVVGQLTAATQVVVVAAILENPWFDDNEVRRQPEKARNANGATGSSASTGVHMGGENPAACTLTFTQLLMQRSFTEDEFAMWLN
ncbi:AT-hook motif nuclear-localized protein 16-like [Hibiscus syriacus]|uniref:AT-hook motif nuclear-localized protein 16-like n=1 Tax=Hibiscus syriacus TaxID=106335 RepID=UPI001923FBE4|nr:AT-hook motif nuclear-localized protein 16-like [Hibiscus syriacus]